MLCFPSHIPFFIQLDSLFLPLIYILCFNLQLSLISSSQPATYLWQTVLGLRDARIIRTSPCFLKAHGWHGEAGMILSHCLWDDFSIGITPDWFLNYTFLEVHLKVTIWENYIYFSPSFRLTDFVVCIFFILSYSILFVFTFSREQVLCLIHFHALHCPLYILGSQ